MRDHRIDVLRGLAMLMMISDHCAFSIFSVVTLAHTQFCDATEIFFLASGYSCMAAFGRRFDSGKFQDGFASLGKNLLRIYLAQVLMLASAFLLMKAWDYVSWVDFMDISVRSRGALHQGVLSSNLFGYHWKDAQFALLAIGAPPYFDVLRTYLVLIAAFPLMWLGLRRAPWVMLAASVLVWVLAHGPHGLAFRDAIDGQAWFFNPFAWQFIFVSGAWLRVVMENRTELPNLPVATVLSLLVLALGLIYQLSKVDLPYLPMFKTNLSPVRMLNAAAIFYLALSREWSPWFTRSLAINAVRIVGRNSLIVYVIGTVISLIVDMADVEIGQGVLTETLMASAGLFVAVGVAHMAERRRSSIATPTRAQLSGRGGLAG